MSNEINLPTDPVPAESLTRDTSNRVEEHHSKSRHHSGSRHRSSRKDYADDKYSRYSRSPRRHSRSPRRHSRSPGYSYRMYRGRSYDDDSRRPERRSRSPRGRYSRRSPSNHQNRNQYNYKPVNTVPEDPLAKERLAQEEATRNLRTLFISDMLPKVDEERIKKYFGITCKVNRVTLIRDKKSGRSKGMGYLELATLEDVSKALMFNGQLLCTKHDACNCSGYPIKVKRSEGDKNITQAVVRAPVSAPSTRIRVSNLPKEMTEEDVKQVFASYGQIDNVTVEFDDEGKSRGIAYISYHSSESAKSAIRKMNNYDFGGYIFSVSLFSNNVTTSSFKLDDNEDSGIVMDSRRRAEIMKKLADNQDSTQMKTTVQQTPNANDIQVDSNGMPIITGNVSHCIVLKDVFNSFEEREENWEKDITDDISSECGKFGTVMHIQLEKGIHGCVYIMFDSIEAAQQAANNLNGRAFNNRRLAVGYVPVGEYISKFPESRRQASDVANKMANRV